MLWAVRDGPTAFPLKPLSAVGACPGLALLLCLFQAGAAGSVSGLLTCFWLRVPSRARAGWPGPLAWPLLGRGRREAQAGALREAAGPQPLAEVASRRLWAVSWSFASGTALGSSPGLCPPAPLPSTQLLEEHRCSGISGYRIIRMNFPGNQNSVSLKTEVHLTPLRMYG